MKGIARKLTDMVKAALFFAVAGFCAGCCQKDLYYPDEPSPSEQATMVDVRFHWDHAENAYVEGMSTYFFPLSPGGRIWQFEIAGMEGGTVVLPPGDYVMIAVNNDLPGVDMSAGETPESVEVTARSYDSGLLRPSGMVYGAASDCVSVPSEISNTEEGSHVVIDLSPDSLATVYNVILKDVAQTDRIESMYAHISGIAESRYIYDGIAGEESGTVNIPISMTEGVLSGSATGLGTPAGTPKFTLTLYATLTDRRKVARSLTFDVTEQVMEAANPHNIYIVVSGIDFDLEGPDTPPQDDGVGMDVDVDGWDSIIIDIITGG